MIGEPEMRTVCLVGNGTRVHLRLLCGLSPHFGFPMALTFDIKKLRAL